MFFPRNSLRTDVINVTVFPYLFAGCVYVKMFKSKRRYYLNLIFTLVQRCAWNASAQIALSFLHIYVVRIFRTRSLSNCLLFDPFLPPFDPSKGSERLYDETGMWLHRERALLWPLIEATEIRRNVACNIYDNFLLKIDKLFPFPRLCHNCYENG